MLKQLGRDEDSGRKLHDEHICGLGVQLVYLRLGLGPGPAERERRENKEMLTMCKCALEIDNLTHLKLLLQPPFVARTQSGDPSSFVLPRVSTTKALGTVPAAPRSYRLGSGLTNLKRLGSRTFKLRHCL